MAIPTTPKDADKTSFPDQTAQPAPEVDIDDADLESDEMSVEDLVQAENSRPTLPDETADGLDDMDEEVRHQAEDLPLD